MRLRAHMFNYTPMAKNRVDLSTPKCILSPTSFTWGNSCSFQEESRDRIEDVKSTRDILAYSKALSVRNHIGRQKAQLDMMTE